MTSETVGPGASDTLEAQSWSVDPVIRFDRIHVIESLPETGRSFRTGAQLFEELEAFCSSTPVVPVFHLVNTGLELFEVLRSCVEEARAGHYPLLHFETHGVERAPGRSTTSIGLSLASGEVVRWPVLGGYLTEINEATRLNLLVFMAACYGADVVTLIRPPSRAPARVVVGPMRPVYVPEIFPATREFYRSMLRDGDGEQAVLAMNRAISKERPTFFPFTAEWLFMHILEGYYNNWTTEPQIAARVERLIVDMALEGISALELARRRERMRAFLRDRKAVFDSHYPPFFFVDKHPELADRFRMSFEACFQTATT